MLTVSAGCTDIPFNNNNNKFSNTSVTFEGDQKNMDPVTDAIENGKRRNVGNFVKSRLKMFDVAEMAPPVSPQPSPSLTPPVNYNTPSLKRRRKPRNAVKIVTDLWACDAILSRIFRGLSVEDISSCVQTCTAWRDHLYSKPTYWLRAVSVYHCRAWRDSTVDQRKKFFTSFVRRRMDAVCFIGLTDDDVDELDGVWAGAQGSVRRLSVRQATLTDAGLQNMLEALPSVVWLELNSCQDVTESGLWASLPPGLLSFTASDCVQIADEAVTALSRRCPELRELELQAYHVTDAGLSGLPLKLVVLRLLHCWELSDAGLAAAATSLPHLTALSVAGCSRLTDGGLEAAAAALPRLRTLDVSWCPRLTDSALEIIAAHLLHLQELILDRCDRITDIGVSHVASMSSLRHVSLRWCTQVRDRSLQYLEALPELSTLAVAGCPLVTPDGLIELLSERPLVELELTNCPAATDDVCEELQTLAPRCEIIR